MPPVPSVLTAVRVPQRVARYFLIQYKRAQEPGEQSQAKSGKSNSKAAAAAAAPSEKTAVGWQTRGLGNGTACIPPLPPQIVSVRAPTKLRLSLCVWGGAAVMDGAAHMPGGWTAHYPKELEAAADR